VVAGELPRLWRRGPIEAPSTGTTTRPRADHFHVYGDVAPLKRAARAHAVRHRRQLPRLWRRGPIEASPPARRSTAARALPRLWRRGPIEAPSPGRPAEHDHLGRNFHVYGDVAPLKPGGGDAAMTRLGMYFHVYGDVAPLKRVSDHAGVSLATDGTSTSMETWPH